MTQQGPSPIPDPTPPSENTIEANVTHEILAQSNESSLSAMTAVSPSRHDEGEKFNYDVLPDPRPGPSGYRQRAVALQFKALNSTDGSIEVGSINGGNSGSYLKVDIDTNQLADIRDPNEGRTYDSGELFYAIPLPASRLAFPEYLQWTLFVNAFALPDQCSRLYIPIYYSPGACSESISFREMKRVVRYHRSAFGNHRFLSQHKCRAWLDEGLRCGFDNWRSLDEFIKQLYSSGEPAPDSYAGPESYPDIFGLTAESAMPRKYGVFAR